MKRALQLSLSVLALVAGVAQAGRYMDDPASTRVDAATPRTTDAAVAYTGRPNESVGLTPLRTEGEAEFAVMTMENGVGDRPVGIINGRPMDNPVR